MFFEKWSQDIYLLEQSALYDMLFWFVNEKTSRMGQFIDTVDLSDENKSARVILLPFCHSILQQIVLHKIDENPPLLQSHLIWSNKKGKLINNKPTRNSKNALQSTHAKPEFTEKLSPFLFAYA